MFPNSAIESNRRSFRYWATVCGRIIISNNENLLEQVGECLPLTDRAVYVDVIDQRITSDQARTSARQRPLPVPIEVLFAFGVEPTKDLSQRLIRPPARSPAPADIARLVYTPSVLCPPGTLCCIPRREEKRRMTARQLEYRSPRERQRRARTSERTSTDRSWCAGIAGFNNHLTYRVHNASLALGATFPAATALGRTGHTGSAAAARE